MLERVPASSSRRTAVGHVTTDLDPDSGDWFGVQASFWYPLERDARLHLPERLTWHAEPSALIYRVRALEVPGDRERHDLTIKFQPFPPRAYGQDPRDCPEVRSSVIRPSKHRFHDGVLCLWPPRDPPERRWSHELGLRVLIEMVRRHLLLELDWLMTGGQDGGRWAMEDAPHGFPDRRRPKARRRGRAA